MNLKLKRGLIAGLLLVGMGWIHKAQAASTDTITLSLTPNATYAVTITSVTAGVGYNFGSVNLNSTTMSTAAIVVTNSGSVYEYFSLSVSNITGGWSTTGAAPSTDTFRLWGQFNPTEPAVNNVNFTTITGVPPLPAGTSYGQASTKTSPTAGSNTKNLWLQLDMPFTLNAASTGQQTMTLSVTGQSS